MLVSMSFMYNKNTRGPRGRMVPWETPDKTVFMLEVQPSTATRTLCVLEVSQVEIHLW